MSALQKLRQKRLWAALVLSAALAHFFSAGSHGSTLLDGVAAVVNGSMILVSDVNKMVAPAYRKLKQTYRGEELDAKVAKAYEDQLNQLIERQLILTCHEKPDSSALDMVVDERLDEMIRSRFAGDRSAFLTALADEQMTIEEWRNEIRDRIIVYEITRREVAESITISPQAVQRRYQADIEEKYSVPEKVKLHMIVLHKGTTKTDTALKREQAVGVRKRMEAGADFAALAKTFSEDSKASEGGVLGWVAYDELKPELAEVASKLEIGKVSEVVETGDAFYVVKVEARSDAGVTPLDDVREEIEQELAKQEYDRHYEAWIGRLRGRSYIKIFEDD